MSINMLLMSIKMRLVSSDMRLISINMLASNHKRPLKYNFLIFRFKPK